jgi:hypothetical protein
MRSRDASASGAVGLSFLAGPVSASTLLTWELSGGLTGSMNPYFVERYPIGTLFTLKITFDPAAPDLTERLYPGLPEGIYHAIAGATLQIGDYSALHRRVTSRSIATGTQDV